MLDVELDLMGAQPALFKLYTQLAFVYPMPDSSSKSHVVSVLNEGLKRLSESFPWVAGQVVHTSSDSDGPLKYRIRPLDSIPKLVEKDYTYEPTVPTFEELEDAGFPMSMMSEDVWAPCPTLSGLTYGTSGSASSNDKTAPVMLAQLSFIKGAVVLCINMQHNVCDMMGQSAVMSLLTKACRGEAFSEHDIVLGQKDRTQVVPLIEAGQWNPVDVLGDQLISLQRRSEDESATARSPALDVKAAELREIQKPQVLGTYFSFRATSLKALKSLATETLPSDREFISMDDAISALIFQSVLRARGPRINNEKRSVTFARAVDARRYLGVDPQYPGVLQNMTYTKYHPSDLLNAPLGHIAAAMREQIDSSSSDVALRTRALVTFLSQSPENATNVSFTASLKTDTDIMLSSWAKVPAYDWDFGFGLGAPVAVRRPAFVPVESLMYIMPKDGRGDVSVWMCLRNDDIERLNEDSEWTRFATHLG
ncbi:unnamed protein product [Periconia digitata]|uniref:Trichothecene 3-O-acetyltransferase-like N-terminal domain-containing protein n=1 Tax=Periconia digitata TaxID=1303443 RepID=A0A9W4XW76_9PLEO|nr:unnamed protein product [Periconia digitata]